MFKAMLAAAGGTESKALVANKMPQASDQKPSTTNSKPTASEPKPKPRTFTELRGIDLSAKDKPKSPITSTNPRSVSTSKKSLSKPTKTTSKPVKPASPAVRPARVSKTTKSAPQREYVEPPTPKQKKLNFMEIMNKAKTVDGSKLKLDMKTITRAEKVAKTDTKTERNSPVDAKKPASKVSPKPRAAATPNLPTASTLKNTRRAKGKETAARGSGTASLPSKPVRPALEKAPVAKPSAQLAARLRKERREYASDSELEDFVVEDDDEGDSGYRSEIWATLGRKPTRQYYDDDSSDDMEATGADLEEEEARSARLARIEDLKEEKRLAALAEAKARKKRK